MRVKLSIMDASWPCETTIRPGAGCAVAIQQAVAREEQRAEHEEVNQRLAREFFQCD